MATYGTWGVFRGGDVVKGVAGAATLIVEPALIVGQDGTNHGLGAGRVINVQFSQQAEEFTVAQPDDFNPPIYTLKLSAIAGSRYVIFDPLTRDVRLVATPGASEVVLKKITWGANTTTMAGLILSDDLRQITRIIRAQDPLGVGGLYHPGMDFGDVSFNAPLILEKILAEIFQAELSVRHGASYAIVLLKAADITVPITGLNSGKLVVSPFEVVRRVKENDVERFEILLTREEHVSALTLAGNAGKRLYVLVNPADGTVSTQFDGVTTGKIIATWADVRTSDTFSTLVWVWSRAQQTRVTLAVTKYGSGEDTSQVIVGSAPWPTPFVEAPAGVNVTRLDNGVLSPESVTPGSDAGGVRLQTSKSALISAIGQTVYNAAPVGKTWNNTFLVTATAARAIAAGASDVYLADGSLVAGG